MTNLVFGSASGIGAEVARQLAPRGPLLLVDRDLDGARKVAAELGSDVEALGCDITDQSQVDAVVARAEALGALVITAGISGAMATAEHVLEVNLRGTARVLDAVESILKPGSAAVCLASVGGHRVPETPELMTLLDDPFSESFFADLDALGVDLGDSGLAYSISKRGVMRLVKRRAQAWGARGARILSISPGIIDTEMSRLQQRTRSDDDYYAEFLKKSPLGRRGQPGEIAQVAAFLTSQQASFMTGSDVLVDGGQAIAALEVGPIYQFR
jgi:NAD(P)-dependent dehydrogenase (short-subunit alcohol dehydrogenase family)